MRLLYIVSATALFGALFSLGAAHTALANVADDLNVNYNKIVNDCGGSNKPAYECSGNIIRLTGTASDKYHVWDPSPNSLNRSKGVSFTYLRHDIKVNLFFQSKTSGVIYFPNLLKPNKVDNSEVRCVFPTDGHTVNGRAEGCGATAGIAGSSPCQDQGIYTADAWYAHFMSVTQNSNYPYQHQCSFTMSDATPNTAAIFNESLNAMRKVYRMDNDGLNHASYNELLLKIAPLDSNNLIANPEKMPIQAFFYMIRTDGSSGLQDARYYQKDYFEKTGIIVPIVKINSKDPANIYFAYTDADQLITVADELNANYNKVVDNCGDNGAPAYKCSGVLFRQDSYSSNRHVWDPSPKSIEYGGISFAYLRKDIQFKNFLHPNRSSGFIYYPSDLVPDGINNTKVSCAFPVGGVTDGRPYGRCGSSVNYSPASTQCQQQGIYTADNWYNHFSDPTISGGNKFVHQCGFDVSDCGHNTAVAFSEAIKAHNMVYDNQAGGSQFGTNEVVVKTQKTDAQGKTVNPEKLPLQAFYYQNAAGLIEAQGYQQDYFNITDKIVPVVYMNTTDMKNISFEYKVSDQVDLKKK